MKSLQDKCDCHYLETPVTAITSSMFSMFLSLMNEKHINWINSYVTEIENVDQGLTHGQYICCPEIYLVASGTLNS